MMTKILITLIIVVMGIFLVHISEWAGKKDATGGIDGFFTLTIFTTVFLILVWLLL